MFIDPNLISAIRTIQDKLENAGIEWYLTGKLNLAIQGVPIDPTKVGLLIHFEDLEKFLQIFSTYPRSEFLELPNGEAREFLLYIDDAEVLVCAEYSHGAYWVELRDFSLYAWEGMSLPCFPLAAERDAYARIGLQDKADIIQDFLDGK